MAEPTKSQVARAMRVCGGGFISRLGSALERADPDNAERIKGAFPDEWARYGAMSVAKTEAENGDD